MIEPATIDERYDLWRRFREYWPLEKIKAMKLEDYVQGNDNNDSFSNWMESLTKPLGEIGGGSAFIHGIYKYKKDRHNERQGQLFDESFAWYSKYGDTAQEAFEQIKKNIVSIIESAQKGDFDKIDSFGKDEKLILGDALTWKLAFLFQDIENPKIVPIYDKDRLRWLLNNFDSAKTNWDLYQELLKFKPLGINIIEFYLNVLGVYSAKPNKYWMLTITDNGWGDYDGEAMLSFPAAQKEACEDFSKEVSINDVVYVRRGSKLICRGVVSSDSVSTETFISRNIQWGKGDELADPSRVRKDFSNLSIKMAHDIEVLFGVISGNEVPMSNYPKREQRFWSWKHTYPGAGDDWKVLVKQAINGKYVMMQYEQRFQTQNNGAMVTQNWNLAKQIMVGDIIFLRGQDHIFAYGKVVAPRKNATQPMDISDNFGGSKFDSQNCNEIITFHSLPFYEDFSQEEEQNWGQRVDVDDWHALLSFENGLYAKDDKYYWGSPQVAIRQVKPEYGNHFIQSLEQKHKELFMATLLENYGKTVVEGLTLLEGNNNLILTGAPGTGKTHDAKIIAALKIGCDVKCIEKSAQFRSVQFHPGYDYADFIVGLKPVLIDESGTEVEKADPGKKVSVSFRWIDGLFKKFADDAKKALDDSVENVSSPYVLLIDEINRADLSRVFGEAFSLLEVDYRYSKANPVSGVKLPSGDSFVLPSNLYIIATMNDIDRSVESMDFALRRRFSWYEVKAADSERIIDAKNDDGSFKISDESIRADLKAKMCAINKYIGTWFNKDDTEHNEPQAVSELGEKRFRLNLGDEYQIGGSYFLNFAKYGETAGFEKLWDNHLKIILSEYLRGNKQRMDILSELHVVYTEATAVTRE